MMMGVDINGEGVFSNNAVMANIDNGGVLMTIEI